MSSFFSFSKEQNTDWQTRIIIYKENVICGMKVVINWQEDFVDACVKESGSEIVVYSDTSKESFQFVVKVLQPQMRSDYGIQLIVYRLNDDSSVIPKLDACIADEKCKLVIDRNLQV